MKGTLWKLALASTPGESRHPSRCLRRPGRRLSRRLWRRRGARGGYGGGAAAAAAMAVAAMAAVARWRRLWRRRTEWATLPRSASRPLPGTDLVPREAASTGTEARPATRRIETRTQTTPMPGLRPPAPATPIATRPEHAGARPRSRLLQSQPGPEQCRCAAAGRLRQSQPGPEHPARRRAAGAGYANRNQG